MFATRLPILPACLLLVASALYGCGLAGSADSDNGQQAAHELCGQPWLLRSLKVGGREHRGGLLWRRLMRERPYFSCDEFGRVSGNSGSNPYTGHLSRSGNQLSWPRAPAVTPMTDLRESSELEQDFLRALPQTEELSFDGKLLILEGAAGSTRLEFQPAETALP